MNEINSPKYQAIQQQILDDISAGRLQGGSQLPSEYGYAERLGVNRLTVRKAYQQLIKRGVLNAAQGRGTFVADAETIRALGITRTRTSRRIIGIILPETTVFFNPILSAIEKCASSNGYMLNVMFNDTPEREAASVESMIKNHVDGIIINPRRDDSPIHTQNYMRLKQSGIPTLMYGRPPRFMRFDSVFSDDITVSYESTCYLIDAGHKHIAHIYYPLGDLVAYQERREGYERAICERLGQDHLILLNAAHEYTVTNAIDDIQNNRYTAIYTDYEAYVILLFSVMYQMHLTIPKGFEMICYACTNELERDNYPTHTLEVPKQEMAERAFGMLQDKILRNANAEYINASIFYPKLRMYKP